MPNRSGITGRYISNAAAARWPRTSVRETGPNQSSGMHHRSTVTGEFITGVQAARNPNTSVTEKD